MKAKVLMSWYYDKSGFNPLRIYLEQDWQQAESDLRLLVEVGSDSRNYSLIEVEIYNGRVVYPTLTKSSNDLTKPEQK